MTAIKFNKVKKGLNAEHRKPEQFSHGISLIVHHEKYGVTEVLDVRFYETEDTFYCCVWFFLENRDGSEFSTYSYSEAFRLAMTAAGVSVPYSTEPLNTVHNIAGALGYDRLQYHIKSYHG